jgi:glycerophosphoryl diester phosphodiesterase
VEVARTSPYTSAEVGTDHVKIYGHRGASGTHPENTMAAFQAVLDLGVDGIETDVHCTSDGIPVLSHDRSMLRMLGIDCLIQSVTYAALKVVAPSVPTLADLLDLVGDQVHLDIEIKQTGIEQAVANVLGGFPQARWAISCFEWNVLEQIRALASEADLWLLALSDTDLLWETAGRLKASGIALFAPEMTAGFVERVHRGKRSAMAWTVNDPVLGQHLQSIGVDALCTDSPERFLTRTSGNVGAGLSTTQVRTNT